MNARTHVLAVAAGIAAFVLVGAAVTELAASRIEFSLFLGLPAGVVAGALAAAGVYRGLATGAGPARRRYARAGGWFGAAFLAAAVVAAGPLGTSLSVALVAAGVVGLLAAVAAFLRRRPEPPRSAGS